MERGDQRVLFSGDVIWALSGDGLSSSPLDRPLGTYSAYLAPRYRGDATAFLSTLRRLRKMPVPDLVLPGHPRNDPTPMSPHLTQRRWEELLDAGIRELERLQARYAKDGANFLDGVPKKLLPDLYYLGEFKEVAAYGFFASSRFFLVNAPGGPGLSDFVSARLRQLGAGPATPVAVLLTSGDGGETAGLADLVEKWQPQVVAPTAAREEVKMACPAGTAILTPEDLAAKNWFSVQAIPLRGRGVAPSAYVLAWGGKTVLLSGPIPIKLTQGTAPALWEQFQRTQVNGADYQASLRQLGELTLDLWLPAFPVAGQNANLYPGDWQHILAENRSLVR
jgi:glyoxylase-like metal-dependent hydrolase (beta-lactamase superfamily II)